MIALLPLGGKRVLFMRSTNQWMLLMHCLEIRREKGKRSLEGKGNLPQQVHNLLLVLNPFMAQKSKKQRNRLRRKLTSKPICQPGDVAAPNPSLPPSFLLRIRMTASSIVAAE